MQGNFVVVVLFDGDASLQWTLFVINSTQFEYVLIEKKEEITSKEPTKKKSLLIGTIYSQSDNRFFLPFFWFCPLHFFLDIYLKESDVFLLFNKRKQDETKRNKKTLNHQMIWYENLERPLPYDLLSINDSVELYITWRRINLSWLNIHLKINSNIPKYYLMNSYKTIKETKDTCSTNI